MLFRTGVSLMVPPSFASRGLHEPLEGPGSQVQATPAEGPAAIRVLMLEDDPNDLELIEQELRRLLPAVSLLVAHDEVSFLAALDEHAPELVLVDYSVPGYGGMGALRAVRERSPR